MVERDGGDERGRGMKARVAAFDEVVRSINCVIY